MASVKSILIEHIESTKKLVRIANENGFDWKERQSKVAAVIALMISDIDEIIEFYELEPRQKNEA